MKVSLTEARTILDALRDAGLTPDDIVQRLELWQIKTNARALKHMYAGRTNMRTVELYALRQLLSEIE